MVSPSHWAALPNPVATDIRSVHGFCRRCAEFHVQLSGFLHQQVMPQLCGCRPTKPDIQRCWKHMCTSRAYVHPLTTCRNGEIHRESFQTYVYTPARMCFCRECVYIIYIYMFTSYHIMYSWYFWCIHLHWPWLPRLWCEGSAPGPHLHAEGHSSPDGDKQTYGGSEPSEMRTLYAVNQLKATRDENLDQLNSKATIQWEY